jgi:hypothetical protein
MMPEDDEEEDDSSFAEGFADLSESDNVPYDLTGTVSIQLPDTRLVETAS